MKAQTDTDGRTDGEMNTGMKVNVQAQTKTDGGTDTGMKANGQTQTEGQTERQKPDEGEWTDGKMEYIRRMDK